MTPATAPPQRFATVPKWWPGSTFVVIGGGSSLTQADVDYCRRKAYVIAVKEAGCSRIPGHPAPAPWADVLYAAEHKYWAFVKGAPDFAGLKYAIEQSDAPPIDWPDVQVLRNTGEHGLELKPTGLRTGYNSGYQAINLAVHFGAKRIILLGFDMWSGPTGQNWFGAHPTHVSSPYPIFHQAFRSIVEPLKAAGVEVVNASRFTVLHAFPRVPLEEALPDDETRLATYDDKRAAYIRETGKQPLDDFPAFQVWMEARP